jgi:peptidoglycan/xylan/chitin deacetylase (PgdA/CDA1 family)
VGRNVGAYPDICKAAAEQGHEVASHTYSHKKLTTATDDEIRRELTDSIIEISKATGFSTTLYRPPYGASDDRVQKISKELGLSLIYWNVDTRDWESKNADKVYAAAMKSAKNGSVIIFHDLFQSTADAIERIVPELIERGFQLVTVSEIFGFESSPAEPGRIYR